MAPKKAVAVKKASNLRKSVGGKAKKISKVKKISKAEKISNAKVAHKETPKIEDAADAFKTFSPNINLIGGLCHIRPLGSGKFEIIELDAVSQDVIGSTEMAELIASVPERQVALNIPKQQWNAAILKCDVAVRTTRRDVFRLFQLPLELRRAIYELVCFNPKGLQLRTKYPEFAKPFSGLGFMCTCSEIYKECNKIFLRNNFRLEHKAIVALRTNTDFAKKLQVIEIDWEGKWADSAILHDITAYPNLRVLNLRFWIGTIKWGRRATRNYQFQDNQDIKWFSKLRGFDFLVSLRGLEKVTFEIYGDMKSEKKEIQDKVPVAQKAMEDLLNRELTKPKLPTLPNAKRASKNKGKGDTDDEDSDQEYIPRPTKSRSRKSI